MNSKILTLALLCSALFTITTQAQTAKGSYMIGGSLTFSKTDSKSTSNTSPVFSSTSEFTSFGLFPSVSYFIINNLALGIEFDAGFSKSENSGNVSNASTFAGGPVIRYYFPIDKLAFYSEVSYSYGKIINKGNIFDQVSGTVEPYKATSDVQIISGGVGVAYFINKYTAVHGLLYYQKYERASSSEYLTDGKQTGINFSAGLYFYLPAE